MCCEQTKLTVGKSYPAILAVMDLCQCLLDTYDCFASQTVWGVYGSEFECVVPGTHWPYRTDTVLLPALNASSLVTKSTVPGTDNEESEK
jgi:hypothetical protein